MHVSMLGSAQKRLRCGMLRDYAENEAGADCLCELRQRNARAGFEVFVCEWV